MSEIKQEILDLLILNGRKPQSIKSGERVVYLYDALNIVNNKFSKTEQPQLNENQQQVLGWLKIGHCDGDSVFEALERITYVNEDPKTEEALESLSPDQEVQVINSFMKWALEQEAE